MDRVYRKMRLVTIGVVAASSMVSGMIAVWHLAPRDVMAETPTWVYLAILALLVCPVLTIVAWSWDRKAAQRELMELERLHRLEQKSSHPSPPIEEREPPAPPAGESRTRRVPHAPRHRTIRHAAK